MIIKKPFDIKIFKNIKDKIVLTELNEIQRPFIRENEDINDDDVSLLLMLKKSENIPINIVQGDVLYDIQKNEFYIMHFSSINGGLIYINILKYVKDDFIKEDENFKYEIPFIEENSRLFIKDLDFNNLRFITNIYYSLNINEEMTRFLDINYPFYFFTKMRKEFMYSFNLNLYVLINDNIVKKEQYACKNIFLKNPNIEWTFDTAIIIGSKKGIKVNVYPFGCIYIRNQSKEDKIGLFSFDEEILYAKIITNDLGYDIISDKNYQIDFDKLNDEYDKILNPLDIKTVEDYEEYVLQFI